MLFQVILCLCKSNYLSAQLYTEHNSERDQMVQKRFIYIKQESNLYENLGLIIYMSPDTGCLAEHPTGYEYLAHLY